MRASRGLAVGVGGIVLLAALPGRAQFPFGSPRPAEAPRGTGPGSGDGARPLPAGTARIGALLPLAGSSSWYGLEIRRGLELAVQELGRKASTPRPSAPEARPGEEARSAEATRPGETARPADAARPTEPTRPAEAAPRALDPPAPGDFPLALEVLEVDPANPKQARERFGQLLVRPVAAVFTASATPTLAIREGAAARDVLVVHQGLVTARFPPGSRVVVHTRPSLALRVEALLREARGRGIGRVAILAAGDDFGKTVRDVVSARGRQLGASLVLEASLSLDTPDLAGRLRELTRLAPDAVVLGFQGADLGDLARAVREAGYAGPLLALDDDPGARLAAGAALDGAVIVAEAFVPAPGSPGARFAEAFRKRFGSNPSRYAANAYEAVAIVLAGLAAAREAGAEAPGGSRLREALLARRAFPSLYGGQVVLRDDGVLDRPLALFTVTRGALDFVRYLGPAPRPAADGPPPRPAPG